MILLIDNYDSFTYNLFQYISGLGADVKVVRNDAITIKDIEELQPEGIVISPGPGLPKDAGICLEMVRHFHTKIPIFGVCLGQQAIGEALGATLRPAKEIKHGKTSFVTHDEQGLFAGLENPVEVMRYHSYVVEVTTLPDELTAVATAIDDNELMAVTHKDYPVYGVQFHPESIGTGTGKQMIRSFLEKTTIQIKELI